MPDLLAHLRADLALLRDAVAALTEGHDALRRGDLDRFAAAQARQEAQVAALTNRASAEAARELAVALGLPPTASLAELAAACPAAEGAALRMVREELRAAAAELHRIHERNATLAEHLRSFLRGAVSGGSPAHAPARYGRSGERLDAPSGGVVQARG
jgi:hypothetical protein